MATINPSGQIGGVNGWKRKEGAVLGWQEENDLFKPFKCDFARNSGGSFILSDGSRSYEYRSNWPRFTYSGGVQNIYNEASSTNLFLNSETLSTQSVTVSNATKYTVSFYGTGTITFSGGHTGSLVGTGVNDRVTATFTTSSTSVTCTVTGSVTEAQFELGAVASSWILTTTASVTRAAETLNASSLVNFLGANGGLVVRVTTPSESGAIALSDGTANNRAYFSYDSGTSKWSFIVVVGGVTQCSITETGTSAAGDVVSLGARFEANDFAFYKDGSAEGTDTSGISFGASTLTRFGLDSGAGSDIFRGLTEFIKFFDQAPINADLIEYTS